MRPVRRPLVAILATLAVVVLGLVGETAQARPSPASFQTIACTSNAADRAGKVMAICKSGFLPNNVIVVALNSKELSGKTLAQVLALADNRAVVQARVSGTCPGAGAIQLVNQDGTVACGSFWGLSGNSGTDPASDFLGTTDNEPFLIKVDGTRVMLYQPTSGTPNVIGGDSGNGVAANVYGAVIGGGGGAFAFQPSLSGPNSVASNFGTIGGGVDNRTGGGFGNPDFDAGATVGGGIGNAATFAETTVAGGVGNVAGSSGATVAGGEDNQAMGQTDAIGGGQLNSGNGINSTIGGGGNNTASMNDAVVGGGTGNSSTNQRADVTGGGLNTASGYAATVAGGDSNQATGQESFVAGGGNNVAQGIGAFAGGRRAKALHDGSFVWTDSNDFDFQDNGFCNPITHVCNANTFNVRATGGTRFVSACDCGSGGTGNPTFGVVLTHGSGSWSSLSDRSLKDHIRPVDPQAVLRKVASLPISTWSYRAQDPDIRHLGPMAQDFYRAFHLGESNRYIDTIDSEGVALAAIKALYARAVTQQAQIASLRSTVGSLQREVATQDRELATLQKEVNLLLSRSVHKG